MAIELLDEHEQGERVRQWLRDNGSAIFGGIALGLALIIGWQWYDRSQAEKRVTAAVQYQALLDAAERDDSDTVAALTTTLADDFGGTPYAHMATLLRAERLVADDPDGAAALLEQARSTIEDPAMRALTTLRLARVRMAQGQAEAALALVREDGLDAWAGLAGEIEGDALSALGRDEEARDAYREALQALDSGAPNRSIVEMKLASAGGTPDAEDA